MIAGKIEEFVEPGGTAAFPVVARYCGQALRTMGAASKAIIVISGLSESHENSAVHMRHTSSGQRTVKVCAEAETVTGPGRTPEMSAGTWRPRWLLE
jgi:hypothetical protein